MSGFIVDHVSIHSDAYGPQGIHPNVLRPSLLKTECGHQHAALTTTGTGPVV